MNELNRTKAKRAQKETNFCRAFGEIIIIIIIKKIEQTGRKKLVIAEISKTKTNKKKS